MESEERDRGRRKEREGGGGKYYTEFSDVKIRTWKT